MYSATPVQIAGGLTGVKTIMAGDRHVLALKSNGTLWAWGKNDQGQLGSGTTANAPLPVQVTGFTSGVPIRDLANGGSAPSSDHSLVLAADGTVWAWGKDDQGQLGDGTSGSYRTIPYHVAGAAAGGIATAVASGD